MTIDLLLISERKLFVNQLQISIFIRNINAMNNKKLFWSAVSGAIIFLGIFLSQYYDYFIIICFLGLIILAIIFNPPRDIPKK